MSDRAALLEARRSLGAAAVMTVEEAARMLGGRMATAREWLEHRNMIPDIPGLGRRVVWGDVLDEIRLGRGPSSEEEPIQVALPRAGIRPRRR